MIPVFDDSKYNFKYLEILRVVELTMLEGGIARDKWRGVEPHSSENPYVVVQTQRTGVMDTCSVLVQEEGIKVECCAEAELCESSILTFDAF